ncbi:hypothetical protein [Chryseobacterium turcicum]|uniref:Uncharacterized protein n=1 Tax=Chryseobacterium turcicum TaxID=2898076 RepID=A0A9Q3V2M6_9FLAO|nr:hypothetical protein [Chryseobacterium turcicum]MCD1116821.1 hypothetical protein [Chryseobacterium turcicum]
MKTQFIRLLFIPAVFICNLNHNEPFTLPLGTKSCNIIYTENPIAIATLLSLHDDENTAIEAFHSLPKEVSFSLLEVSQVGNGKRNLIFGLKDQIYEFDPNRVFSTEGINRTFNSKYPKEFKIGLEKFGKDLLKEFSTKNKNKYIIAVHNNMDGYGGNNGTASIINYKKGVNAKDVFSAKGVDPDDYFVVTEQEDFDKLKNLNKNVALETDKPTDDGSLSVYCKENKIPYINIEAQNEHKDIQIEMMKIVFELLKEKKDGI